MFSCEFGEISKNTLFTGHLWATVSEVVFNRIPNMLKFWNPGIAWSVAVSVGFLFLYKHFSIYLIFYLSLPNRMLCFDFILP